MVGASVSNSVAETLLFLVVAQEFWISPCTLFIYSRKGSQYCCFPLFCVVDCREMLTVSPLLIVQFSALVLSPLSSRDVPLNMYSVR